MGEQKRLSGCIICMHVIEAEAVLEYKKIKFHRCWREDNNSYTFVSLSTFTRIISLETHTHPGRYVAWLPYHPTDGFRALGRLRESSGAWARARGQFTGEAGTTLRPPILTTRECWCICLFFSKSGRENS